MARSSRFGAAGCTSSPDTPPPGAARRSPVARRSGPRCGRTAVEQLRTVRTYRPAVTTRPMVAVSSGPGPRFRWEGAAAMSVDGTETAPLRLSASPLRRGTVRLAVAGEVDLGTGDALREAMTRLMGDGRLTRLVVDFADVSFL